MKTTSYDNVSFMPNVTSESQSRQGKNGLVGGSFSSIIGKVTITNQATQTELTSQQAVNKATTKTNTDSVNKADTSQTQVGGSNRVVDKPENDLKDASALENSAEASASSSSDTSEVLEKSPSIQANQSVSGNKEATEVLDEAQEAIKTLLLKVLNVSEEDLESAMQALGISYLDCLDKSNLSQLLTQITGNNDISALITNEDLYQTFQNSVALLSDIKDELLTKFGITEQDLAAVIEQVTSTSQMTEEPVGIVKEMQQDVYTEQSADSNETLEVTASTLTKNPEEANSKKQIGNITDIQEEMSSNTIKEKIVAVASANNSEQQSLTEDKSMKTVMELPKQEEATFDEQPKFVLPNQTVDNLTTDVQGEVLQANRNTTVDVDSVIKQIQNQIKLSAGIDTTSIAFQLNPEHLGKLTIQVASKQGTITAQITAQNQAVKEVIESQIVQLKENMNNQGLKVEAVEVTVESHAFERNLEEGNHNSNQEQFEQQQKNARRQLNYNDLETMEDLTEEEAIIAQMMVGNGNSVNYTV